MIPGASSAPAGERQRLYGVYPAIVTDVQDPALLVEFLLNPFFSA